MIGTRVWTPFLAVLLVAILTACAPAAAPASTSTSPSGQAEDPEWQKIVDAGKKEGKLLVYGLLLAGPEGAKIADEFRKKHGITADFVSGPGAPTVQRLREEAKAGQPSADIWEGAFPWVGIVQKEGFFVSLKGKPLPAFKEPKSTWHVDPTYMSESVEFVTSRLSQTPGHINVNTKLLSPADYPKSWQDLSTNPKYKGKIAWVDPKTTGEIAFRWTLYGYVGNAWNLQDVWSVYTNQNVLLFPTPLEVGPAMARGEASIGIGNSSLESAAEAGAPFKLLFFPDVPFVDIPSAMGVIKNARNPNAALVFINWVLSKEGQEFISKTNRARTLRRDVPDQLHPALKPEVVGGGKAGPHLMVTAAQAQLTGELHSSLPIWQRLPQGVPFPEFEAAVTGFIKEWESKQGGPQRQQIKAGE